MQKQAPTFGRLLTMALFALSCFGLLLFLWISFGGPTPLKPEGYRFKVAFPEAVQLGLEADVRVAGVSVGKVRAKDIDRAHPNRTVATIEVDPKFAPVASDARAILRQKTLLGETYVELTPGTKSAPRVKEGGMLADGRVAKTVELDEIFDALDPVTRQAFRTWQRDLAGSVRGRGQDLNDAFGTLPRFAVSADDLLAVLDGQSGAVSRLVRNTGEVFGALTQDERQLHNLIVNAGDVFSATARRQEALAQTFKIFPTFLDESKATFAKLEGFSHNTRPLIHDLRPAARDLRPTLRDARRLAPDLESTFRNLDPLITVSKKGLPALRDVLGATTPLLAQTQPFLEQLNPILQWLEIYQSQVADFISNGAGALADTVPTIDSDERGHYLRQWGPVGPEAVAMWGNRLDTNRGNAYPRPDSFTGADHAKYMIFANFDCKNAPGGGTYLTKTPNTDDKPSCFEMKPLDFPPGNTLKFPHIGPADYSASPAKK
jgi:virulence factor Mce-like protein